MRNIKEMTNKEYLQNLSPEELVKTWYFQCPYSKIIIASEEARGNYICRKNELLKNLKDGKEIAEFVFSGKQEKVCNECKIKWLSENKE